MHFLSFTWNPSEGIDLGFFVIRYYSIMFIVAFTLGWYLMKKIFVKEGINLELLDKLFIYAVISLLAGARIGHVLFYQSELITQDPLAVFLPIQTVPEFKFTGFQGLASHGATILGLIAMYYFNKKYLKAKILWLLDRFVIPVAAGTVFVRIGNFINSEIIGKPTEESFPLAVQFVRSDIGKNEAMRITGTKDHNQAFDAIVNNPKFSDVLNEIPFSHPAQLYKAFGYIFVFLILWFVYWKTDKSKQSGFLFGLFFVLLFTVRFFAEYYKKSQGGFESMLGDSLSTGQWLSIPFILIGLYFMIQSRKKVTP